MGLVFESSIKHVLGKCLGALFGFVLAGADGAAWWGVLVGAFLGHPFDQFVRKEVSEISQFSLRLPAGRRQEIFFKAMFSSLGFIVKMDDSVREDDKPLINLCDRLELDEERRKKAKEHYEFGQSDEMDIVATMREFRRRCGAYRGVYLAFFDGLTEVVCINDQQSAARNVLQEMARQLRISMIELDRMVRSKSTVEKVDANELEQAWTRLHIQPTDDEKEIKHAYRRQMSLYHPDRLIAKGVPPEVVDIGKQQTQAIQAAYQLIIAQLKT